MKRYFKGWDGGDPLFRKHGQRSHKWPPRVATKRHRRLCERHGHRLGHPMSYAGSSQTFGGDWLHKTESGTYRSCIRCREGFYYDVKMSQETRPQWIHWSEPQRDEWQQDPDAWQEDRPT